MNNNGDMNNGYKAYPEYKNKDKLVAEYSVSDLKHPLKYRKNISG